MREREEPADRGVPLARQRAPEQRRELGGRGAGERLGGGAARRGIGVEEPENRERGPELAADAVVDVDGLGALRRRLERLAGRGVDRPAVDRAHHPLADAREGALRERLEHRRRRRIALADELPDAGELLLGVLGAEPAHGARVERGGERGERERAE